MNNKEKYKKSGTDESQHKLLQSISMNMSTTTTTRGHKSENDWGDGYP